jgi:hypothetical protein
MTDEQHEAVNEILETHDLKSFRQERIEGEEFVFLRVFSGTPATKHSPAGVLVYIIHADGTKEL